MSEAIFQTTGQALHVSYLIMSVEARQKNALRMALIQIIESVELPNNRLKAWLAQLRGESSGTVNFDGLDAYEVRAQCAMVTQVVKDHLPGPERYAVIGAYTKLPLEKAEAVRYLSNYIKPEADSRQRLLFDYCVLRCTSKYGNEHVKSAGVLERLGVTDKSAAAHLREFRKKFNALLERGESHLDGMFKKHGLVNAN